MTAMNSAILSLGHTEEELFTACRAAADALEILSNLQPGFTRNVIPRINSSTAVSVSQANSGERQVNDEEIQANESAVQSSTTPASSSSIQARLVTLFPRVGSNRASRKDTSRRPAKSNTCLQGCNPYSQSQNQQSAYNTIGNLPTLIYSNSIRCGNRFSIAVLRELASQLFVVDKFSLSSN